ncbi:hypothetical protein DFJ58DRAFT_840364 [Suillus subalutaceus]|uniref:uncharacterized protein n=1 Tax=Suillus subalutaceus TaxID=48586 RepID=UPI001B878215|nr:uncharacterized protein DFJ58DRAFT_840364 [Suillus subalutaceus]KAG1858779.1 hypothetical protein DFJ58DRAFT_840364 [Suillus subalutaceus]
MPPTHLLQCNSSCVSPLLSGSVKGPSPENVKRHSTSTTSLVKNRATAFVVESTSNLEVPKVPQSKPEMLKPENIEMRNQTYRVLYLQIFSNVSEESYDYVLNVIGCDDNLVCKPSYIPRLEQLVATLPSPIHEAILVPLRTAMGITVNSFIIPDDFKVSLPIHMACMVDAPATADLPPSDESYHLGIPDMVLTFQTGNDILPFWPFEVSISQTSEAAVTKLQKFADRNENVLAATHIHISEAQKHSLPTFEWGVERDLAKRGVQMKELTYSENGGFASLSHTWCHPVTVTISTWIRPPGKPLNLKSRSSRYYVTAVLCPNQDEGALKKSEHAQDEELLDSLKAVKKWTPPKEFLNWDTCRKELWPAAKQTGFDWYRSWHRNFLKRAADESEVIPSSSRTTNRGRVM